MYVAVELKSSQFSTAVARRLKQALISFYLTQFWHFFQQDLVQKVNNAIHCIAQLVPNTYAVKVINPPVDTAISPLQAIHVVQNRHIGTQK